MKDDRDDEVWTVSDISMLAGEEDTRLSEKSDADLRVEADLLVKTRSALDELIPNWRTGPDLELDLLSSTAAGAGSLQIRLWLQVTHVEFPEKDDGAWTGVFDLRAIAAEIEERAVSLENVVGIILEHALDAFMPGWRNGPDLELALTSQRDDGVLLKFTATTSCWRTDFSDRPM